MKRLYLKKLTRAVMLGMVGLLISLVPEAQAGKRDVVAECMRCHDVKTYQYELKHSSHAVDKDNKTISCEQCHDSHFSSYTEYFARDKYFDKKIFKPEDFDRKKMQQNVKKAVPARKCQVCHEDLSKNVKGEKISEIGQLCHDAFEGKNGSTNRNCAGCHINVAHLPIFDRSLTINADFAKRLAENPLANETKKEDK